MTQQPLPLAAARKDPWTSKKAARELDKSGARLRQIDLVAGLVAEHPGCTSAELAAKTGVDRALIARRLPDAERLGRVKRGPAKRCAVNGTEAIAWESK